jgi:DNA-3-methyladenine glycosylase
MRLPRQALAVRALELAPRLLGAVLAAGDVAVQLTEVEAYEGLDDPASHAFRGPTNRNAVMFGPPGHLYCYFTYGMHWCANVVCGPEGTASAVLLRAGRVVDGVEVARQRRPAARSDTDLARGPARLASCLGLDRSTNGADLLAEDAPVRLTGLPEAAPPHSTGPRVGITTAVERPWRFWLPGDPTVSAYRAGGRRRAGVG